MARIPKGLNQDELLSAALEGLELQKMRIEAQIAEVRVLLGKRPPRAPAGAVAAVGGNLAPSGHRRLSPEARERIAAAQKKRWKEYRKNKRASAQT